MNKGFRFFYVLVNYISVFSILWCIIKQLYILYTHSFPSVIHIAIAIYNDASYKGNMDAMTIKANSGIQTIELV